MKSSFFKRTAKVLGTWEGDSRQAVTVPAELGKSSTAQGCMRLMNWDGGELAKRRGKGAGGGVGGENWHFRSLRPDLLLKLFLPWVDNFHDCFVPELKGNLMLLSLADGKQE